MTSWRQDTWTVDDRDLQPALSLAMLLSRASMGLLLLRNGDAGSLRTVIAEGLTRDESLMFGGGARTLAAIANACSTRRRVIIRDARVDDADGAEGVRELSQRIGFRGLEILPLERNGDITVGALALLFRHPLRQTARTEQVTALTAALIAQALDNARLRAEAERRAAERLQFLARINHELRTPLQSITGYVELLKDDAEHPTERQRSMLDRIQHSEEMILSLIEDLANLSKIDAGSMTYELTGVQVTEVLARAEAIVRPLAKKLGVRLVIHPPPPALQVHADPRKLTQVLVNFVTNALKFTPKGRSVTVEARRNGARVDLVVQDEGPGIPADQLGAIFEPYVQIDQRRDGLLSGFGLGLAISREFANGMGGKLIAENIGTPARGAAFTCSIRVHRRDRTLWRSRLNPVSAGASAPIPGQLPTSL